MPEQPGRSESRRPGIQRAEDFLRVDMVGELEAQAVEKHRAGEQRQPHRNPFARDRGEVSADVTSATALSKEQVANLAETLKQKIGKTVTLTEHVDPSLIGGLVVKVGSQMIDSSLKTKLSAIKIAMKEVG